MAKRKSYDSTEKRTRKRRLELFSNLKDETLQGVLAVLAFVGATLSILSAWRTESTPFGKAGIAGHYFFDWLHFLFGIGYYLLPVIFITLGLLYLKHLHRKFDILKLVGSLLFLLASLGIIDIIAASRAGFVGAWVAYPFVKLVDEGASLVILSSIVVISILIAFNTEVDLASLAFWRKEKDDKKKDKEEKEDEEVNIKIPLPEEAPLKEEKKPDLKEDDKKKLKVASALVDDTKDFIKPKQNYTQREYEAPPLSLLERDKGKPEVGDVKANANIIKRTLANFGIDVEMDEVSIGPSVTRYALKPAEGVKLARIVGLQNDLSLALAAHPLRIEAPIPGKALVGIEIPNTTKTTVGLGTLFTGEEFQTSDKPLLTALGKGISGKSHFANLAKMPHLLIAGATGSGKSVTIHALIVSLIYRNSPDQLKFIMIDPKRVELTLYNKIPHLITPVITDAKKAILSLKWAAKEMDRRYDILQQKGVRDIDSYHKNVVAPLKNKKPVEGEEEKPVDPMPYIVVVIDELADLMQAYPRELEAGIVRLAQMSRAVGIHLMLSTQRPSVNVITGLIKANIPARLALQVASQIDSRTILDMPGAEKLLGAGDMLFLSGEMSKPQRIQCAFISESEVKKVVQHLIDTHQDQLNADEINLTDSAIVGKNSIFEASFDEAGSTDEADDDDLYEEARQVVLEAGKASTSYIQRKLRVGYARAARLVDILEKRGVIGPADGSKPRSVIGGNESETGASHADTDDEHKEI
jgi:S-DNA-T family DNA segregation ATPase FtsK/SpoIIIE